LLEGLAVLLGVLVAFSVESWGADLDEARLGASYQAALESELAANLERAQQRLEDTDARLERSGSYLRTVIHADPSTVSEDQVNQMLLGLGPFRVSAFQRAALDDILNSGGLVVLRSDEIRRGILTYSRFLDQEALSQQFASDFWENHMSPYYFEHGGLSEFFASDLPDLDERADLRAFVGSRRYSNLILERQVRDGVVRRGLVALVEHMETLHHLLEQP